MTDQVENILVEDLANPILSDVQKEFVAQLEKAPRVELSENSILEAAKQRTGLSDFGPDDFRERLQVWLEDFEDDNPNNLGRTVLFQRCVRHASNRLRIQDTLKRHPEIHDVEIKAPVIVSGLPRSGTTNLVNMIAADQRFESIPLWECLEPIPYTTEDGNDPRYQSCQNEWEQFQLMMPSMAAMHPMDPEHIHEEVDLQCADFSSFIVDWWIQAAPRWRDYYLSHDQTPHYEYLKTVIKILQWQRGNDDITWVLKSPQHMENISVLMSAFPDATVVFTHRDPVAVIQSNSTMIAYAQRAYHHTVVDTTKVVNFWADRIEKTLRRCVRDRDLISSDQSLDVMFNEYMSNQMGTVESVYEKAGIELTDTARQAINEYINDHPREKGGRMIYDLRTQFGANPDEIRTHFDFYFDRFPIEVSVK